LWRAKVAQEVLQSSIRMRSATGHRDVLPVQFTCTDPDRGLVGDRLESTLALAGVIQQILVRRVDDTHHRPPLLYQGDIDGEFAVALDEFARAVERIHQPVTFPALAYG